MKSTEVPRKITLLGSTGSIGKQTLEVMAQFPSDFEVFALSAGENLALLAQQVQKYLPQYICIASHERVLELKALLPDFKGEVLSGDEGLKVLTTLDEVDTVVVGLVGMRGLPPTLAALEAGKCVLTANKETFVAGGHLVQPYLEQIVPIDSEHSALHQCLGGQPVSAVSKLYLTASGGPFRNHSMETLQRVTKAEALKHPNWVMGEKITIDSASMMNKGLEVIEARWLFDIPYEQIQIVVHPQSIIHSCVAFSDGNILAQMGTPDMRVPIQYALTWPNRLESPFQACHLNLLECGPLEFQSPDEVRFPCLRLAREAGRMGGTATTVLNAADEIAVQRFLDEEIPFTAIATVIEKTVEAHQGEAFLSSPTLDEIISTDAWAREYAMNVEALPQFVQA